LLEPRVVLQAGPLVINEIMADNDSTKADVDGDFEDWIEIANLANEPQSLDGWYLTDEEDDLTKWQFPDVTLPAGGHLLVFASGKDRTIAGAELHTNFNLDAAGEYLALIEPNGFTVSQEFAPQFPRQLEDVSYGLADPTTLWDTLVSPGVSVSYRVPTAEDDVTAWTAQDFDGTGFTDVVTLDAAGLVVTEIETGTTDWLEIQNVSAAPIDTSGWFVAVNDTAADDINDVNAVLWPLPEAIAAGEVLYRTDDQADNYFGGPIDWSSGSGWVMIVDDAGAIVDFVPWGYDEADIASLEIAAGGFDRITVGDRWQGDGVPGGSGQTELIPMDQTWSFEESGTDLGTEWRAVDYRDQAWDSGRALLYHETSGLPEPKRTPLDLGEMTYYFRTHFNLDAHPAAVTELTMHSVLDDGMVVYLNGPEAYRLGMRDEPVTHNTTAGRTVGNASREGPFSLPTGGLVAGDNVLAVEVHQTGSGSSDVVFGLQLEATVLEPALARVGGSDLNQSGDFAPPAAPSRGVQNPGMNVPFVPGTIPALTGIGFGDDADFNHLIQTDVAAAALGTSASLFCRIEFPTQDTSHVDELLLRMQYDDGYVAYLNGVEVARRNAPEDLQSDSTATAERPDALAVQFEETNLSDDLHALRPMATNVLAIHVLNRSADDGDLLMVPELIARSDLDEPQYMTAPTAGAANRAGALGLVADTAFSVDRGFYDAPFTVEITSNTIGAEIRYTLDGSPPTATTGNVYIDPIAVNTTTTLRAAAFKSGYLPTNVDTQTYIFLDDVVRQPGNPAGFPSSWGGTTADYQMDPDVVNSPQYGGQMRDALLSLPTMSIVTNQDDLFGNDGIYTNSNSQGRNWERATSVEWINTDGTTGFQVDAGLRIYGGAFRGMGLTRKKTFRLLFKRDYGPTKLEFPMFDAETATDRFDTIILRAGANDGWNNWGDGDTQYIVDEFMRRTQLALGEASAHGTFVHLYVNGLYWGLYNPVERPEASFSATYYGGDKTEWDALNSGNPTGESNTGTWSALLSQTRAGLSDQASYQRVQGNNPDGTNNPAYDDLLDVDNYIDYMFTNFWGGTGDWPGHNWYNACRRPPNAGGFKSYNWDSEGAIVVWSSLTANRTGVNNSLAEPYAELRSNPEFNLLFADHAHRHLFNGGAATPDVSYQRYKDLADEVELAIIAESARWGDQSRSNNPYTQADWRSTRDYVLDTYMPQRPAVVLQQLRAAGLYPSVVAPEFNRHGGEVPSGFPLSMTTTQGAVYDETVVVPEFTAARYFVPTNDNLGTNWTAWGFNDGAWPAGQTGIGYENSPDDYRNLLKTQVVPRDAHANATAILVRIPFTVNDLDTVDKLTLRMKYDDGFVAYINGHEVDRRNFTGTPNWNSRASSHSDSQAVRFEDFDLTDDLHRLVEGSQNVLSIHGLNTSAGSSDMLVLPELSVGRRVVDPDGPDMYYTTDGSDPRLVGGGISPTAARYNGTPIALSESGPIKSRTFESGQWSALNAATFYVDTQATAENLVVSELMYNPSDPTAAELAIDETFDNDDFEFIELQNTSDRPIDLTGVTLVGDIEFEFAEGDVIRLGAGEQVVIASNMAAFTARYGTDGVRLAGQYLNRLGNGGETIEVRDWTGGTIALFAYDDGGTWPGRADGKGASLQLRDPSAVPTAELARQSFLEDGDNWRSSVAFGGTPAATAASSTGIVVNEVLTHTDAPQVDAIELHNTTAATVDLGGWFLSDSWGWESNTGNGDYRKFRIPDGTTIAAGGYIVFYEGHYAGDVLAFDQATEFGGPGEKDFALSGARGDDVWLMEADAAGNLTRFADHVEFPAAANGESFGRWPNAGGRMYPMSELTLGDANTAARIGPVVISEVMYRPPEGGDEFIELYNAAGHNVPLYDPAMPDNTWRIGGVSYTFPEGAEIPAHGVAMVVPVEPALFRTAHGLAEDVQVFGPYSGGLDNDGESVKLLRPGEPTLDPNLIVPYLLVDQIDYMPQLPWPVSADGGGDSLHRAALNSGGTYAASWPAAAPTPGDVSRLAVTAVVGRYLFYNGSSFDGQDPGVNAADDTAIAPDKKALLPGGIAGFENYTSYGPGLNGLMIDVAGLPGGATPGLDDFSFAVGNGNDPPAWAVGPQPTAVAVRRGDGVGGSDRISIVWDDFAIRGEWLQVTVLAAGLGLSENDVFYFGNAVAEAGNSTIDTMVTTTDLLLARNNSRNFLDPADLDFAYDYNRDSRVNATDVLLARNNQTNFLTALKLLDFSGGDGQRQAEEDRTSIGPIAAAVDALLLLPSGQ